MVSVSGSQGVPRGPLGAATRKRMILQAGGLWLLFGDFEATLMILEEILEYQGKVRQPLKEVQALEAPGNHMLG